MMKREEGANVKAITGYFHLTGFRERVGGGGIPLLAALLLAYFTLK
jgi:hypothetical protein